MMCGRYYTEIEIEELMEIIKEVNRRIVERDLRDKMKVGEIFPTNVAPVIAAGGATLMSWGLQIPNESRPIINARVETVREKPLFRGGIASRRVAVPTSGFFEWMHEGKKATDKYLFRQRDSKVLYLAGLYNEYKTPDGVERKFTILTTAPNESMSAFHNRMPVYLGRDEINAWTQDDGCVDEIIRRPQPELIATKWETPKKPEPDKPVQLSMF